MTQDDVRALIRGLERNSVPLARWHHDTHLAMAVWYLSYLPRRQALRVIRDRIVAQNEAVGIAGRYHETVSLFFARGVGACLDALPEETCFDERLHLVLGAFRDYRPLVRRYYTTHTIDSVTARTRWVEPDRRPMHVWLRECADVATRRVHAEPRLAEAS